MSKILVINDDEAKYFMALAAKGDKREIVVASSAEEAILLIQQHNFDVIITDQRMETARSGIDVLIAAKKKDVHCQVIVVTAYGTPEVSIEAMRLGAFDYLERSTAYMDSLTIIKHKITLALEFREAKLNSSSTQNTQYLSGAKDDEIFL